MLRFALASSFLMAGIALMSGCGMIRAAQEHATADGRIFLVAPNGTPEGNGSAQKPLDIVTALGETSPAKPGDTIHLASGTYEGALKDIQRLPFVVAVSGEAEKPVRIMPAPNAVVHLNGTIDITGSYVWVICLEIGDLTWDIQEKTRKNGAAVQLGQCDGVRIINCNLFGGWNGVTSRSVTTNAEYYGCLVHDFGSWGHNAPGGSSFYLQNTTGTQVVSNCVCYRSAALGMAPHGQGGPVTGFDIVENIIALSGAVAPKNNYENVFINTSAVKDRLHLARNVIYQPDATRPWKANVRMSNYKEPTLNKSGIFEDNYVMGATTGLRLAPWENFRASGNTTWAERILVEVSSSTVGDGVPAQEKKPDLSGYHFSGNAYYMPENPKPFLYSNREKDNDADLITLAEWQKLGLDKDAKLLPTRNGKPTGTKIFVFPNKYQTGRANVAVFNWDGLKEVEVDLSSALTQGARFAVYNVLDVKQTLALAKPIMTDTYAGGKVRLPMRKDPASPDFDAFLVVPQ